MEILRHAAIAFLGAMTWALVAGALILVSDLTRTDWPARIGFAMFCLPFVLLSGLCVAVLIPGCFDLADNEGVLAVERSAVEAEPCSGVGNHLAAKDRARGETDHRLNRIVVEHQEFVRLDPNPARHSRGENVGKAVDDAVSPSVDDGIVNGRTAILERGQEETDQRDCHGALPEIDGIHAEITDNPVRVDDGTDSNGHVVALPFGLATVGTAGHVCGDDGRAGGETGGDGGYDGDDFGRVHDGQTTTIRMERQH